MKNKIYILFILTLFASCTEEEKTNTIQHFAPVTSNNGQTVTFQDEAAISFFETEIISSQNINSDLRAPGKIVANIFRSGVGASQNVILFSDSDLSSHYTQLVQHQINIQQIQNVNIKQKELELERVKELIKYGAATGQDLLTTETELAIEKTNLANEKASLIEHESYLKSGGFRAEELQKAKAGTAYLICDIPENQIGSIEENQACKVTFTAFPKDTILGEIDAITDQIDNNTRMLKVRIIMDNSNGRLKTGMFANVSFGTTQNDIVSVSKEAMITVQGNHYVFVKKSANEFERRQIQTGHQVGDRIIVYGGLDVDEQIAVKGVMQLKGLSFGY